jgi:hypothetical protein
MSQTAHTQPQNVVHRPSRQEWQDGVERELAALGLTYTELAEQARNRDFQSPEAMNLWVIIGEPRG